MADTGEEYEDFEEEEDEEEMVSACLLSGTIALQYSDLVYI